MVRLNQDLNPGQITRVWFHIRLNRTVVKNKNLVPDPNIKIAPQPRSPHAHTHTEKLITDQM